MSTNNTLPTDIDPDPTRQLRHTVYALLIAIAIGTLLGRIFAVDSVESLKLEASRLSQIEGKLAEKRERLEAGGATPQRINEELAKTRSALIRDARLGRPMLSANDRSRWCTLRALVEPDMRVTRDVQIEDGTTRREYVWYAIDKVTCQKGWDTIDMVKHGLPSGSERQAYLYSSKPPLLPTLMAVPYWCIYNTTGYTLGTHTYGMVRTLLVLMNVVPWLIILVLTARLAERFGTTDWGRIFVVASACFATLLTTFAIVLNNHLPGAFCVLVAMYAAIRIWFDGRLELRYFAIAAFFAAMSVACELPAALFFGMLGLVLLCRYPWQTIQSGVPAALLIGAGFFATNWIAHESLIPPYAHRSDEIADTDRIYKTEPALVDATYSDVNLPTENRKPPTENQQYWNPKNWYDYAYERNGRVYECYWNHRVGIDRGEQSIDWYVIHSTIGHHGVFSLTPVWLLSMFGLGLWITRPGDDPRLRQLALFIAGLSGVCFIFYMMRGQDDRNYGGMTCGFRWMFFFAPLWLITMIPAADRMAKSRTTRGIALVLLAISCIAVAYPTWNPWTHPWILNWLHYMDWWRLPTG